MRYQRAESPALLNGHAAARRFFAACFDEAGSAQEQLWVAHVDQSAHCIQLDRYEGETAAVDLPVRTIVADAARLGSSGVVLAHNHPSGDANPSRADCRATRSLAQAAEAIDLTVLDHLIFAPGDECRSMRRMGLL
ncbi:MAG: JAB domain-containing protein [Sphingomonas sp.]|uniref:JAB domain-containing protein n=1 Tax=Sphingomonas sp. TaxID=28214 RepID=UPI001832ACB6|nr:JAB domain-containing protein [Sphingomonas sp.]MBA3666774.1 JAB domain-containing protein [Sphingomonas sp.]